MLQYTVHPPPLSFSSGPKKQSSTNSKFRSNDSSKPSQARKPLTSPSALSQKRPTVEEPSSANRLPTALAHPSPSLHLPLSVTSSFAGSPLPTPSLAQHSRPSYFPPVAQQPSPSMMANSPIEESRSSRHSSTSSVVADILSQGDVVGEGIDLQGEPLRKVAIDSHRPSPVADYEEPACEFEVVRKLGTGSYAVVYLVREVLSRSPPSEGDHIYGGRLELDEDSSPRPKVEYGRDFAIKLLSKANLDEDALAAQMVEATIHQSLPNHPNIVTLHRTLESSSYLLLLLEFVPGEDLFYFLEQARDHFDPASDDPNVSTSRTPPTPGLLSSLHPAQLLSHTRLRLIASMFSQMCEAVSVCHESSVFHRDIKPENFIVTDGWTTNADGVRERKVVVKLTDFGLSTTDVESSDMDCGSAPYMSYECRNNVAPTYRPRAADVWSLGIVLINMLYHYNPWTDTAHEGCSSFDVFRQQPVNFFMQRFAGMTFPVAHFLADKVFCILHDSTDDSQRISARDFGLWAKDLPTLLGQTHQRPSHSRVSSTTSITGHPLSSVPPSRRPSSRASIAGSPFRTSIPLSLGLSHAPSVGPAFEEATALSLCEEAEEPEADIEERDRSESRAASSTKRRKRGARKGKGVLHTSASGRDLTSDMLASASESLARELSRASKPKSSLKSPSVSSIMLPSEASSPRLPDVEPAVVKKPSKWRLGFGKASSASSNDHPASSGRPALPESASSRSDASLKQPSATASNVTNLIMGLNATAPHSPPEDKDATWGRGRQPRPSAAQSSSNLSGTWPRDTAHSPASSGHGHSQVGSSDSGIEQWASNVDRRGVSPTSTRNGKPLASSASSIASSNWRSSMSSTNTSTSGFTKYSNQSVRSVSTYATSLSSASSNNWRNNNGKQPARGKYPYGPQQPPPNVKIMSGVPWELSELPRQLHSDPNGDVFGEPPGQRKQRVRKPKSTQALGSIPERPADSSPQKRGPYRQDAATSTTDLDGLCHDGGSADSSFDSPKKVVQKGQINALAKMLSALRR